MPQPPPMPTGGAPEGCTTWFDGCNTCGRDSPTVPMACTMMACFRQGNPECRGWAVGYGPSSSATATTATGGVCGNTQTLTPACSRSICRNMGATTQAACMAGGANSCCQWTAAGSLSVAPAPAPAGAPRCSTTATRGRPHGAPCPDRMQCVITDPGHPEFDQPNSGY